MSPQIDYKQWMLRLNEVSSELMQARSLSNLLSTILTQTRQLTSSDAGSIYRVIRDESPPKLVFEQAQNDTVELPDQQFTFELDRSSLAGYAAAEETIINISDVYELPEDEPYEFDQQIDKTLNYRTKSMLVIPLKNREGTVRGVLQLINRKSDKEKTINKTDIIDYPESLVEVVKPFSHQAAVALERAELDNSIQSMVHSMIQTLVNALDKRDKITTGHSRRVAGYGYHLAMAIDESREAPWDEVNLEDSDIRRLYYAGLLHDIGKIAVPEDVLNKKNRLSDEAMEAIYYRLMYFEETDGLDDAGEIYERIQSINQSGYLEEDDENFLKNLHEQEFEDPCGEKMTPLSQEEYKNLSIKRGNLTDEERQVMESHAKVTFEILSEVGWTNELTNVPKLAAAHHERLDGSGYPWGKTGEELSLLSRILAVVDVYEALTARDRPYRSAMEHEQARDILLEESENGNLDSEIIDIFLSAKVYNESVEELPEFELA